MDDALPLMSLKTVIGAGVETPAGEVVGFIQDAMIDPAGGNIGYLVVTFGGFFGIGSKSVVLDWSVVARKNGRFVLQGDLQSVKNAPRFVDDMSLTARYFWASQAWRMQPRGDRQ